MTEPLSYEGCWKRCWTRGSFADGQGRFCLRGGLDHLRGNGDAGDGQAELLLLAAIKEHHGWEMPTVQANDGARTATLSTGLSRAPAPINENPLTKVPSPNIVSTPNTDSDGPVLNTLLAMSSSLVLAAANPSATGGSVENFAFGVTSGSQYALPDSGSETYTLVETAGSPPIIAIELPAETASAAQFSVSHLTGSMWSSATVEAPGSTVSLPNAEGVKVTLLDNTGAPIAAPGDLTFYLEFGSGGTFSGSITGNVPPPEKTYTPTTLPSGGNPPISGQPNPVPCFRSGTHVLTQRGSVRVENLRIGDLVITYAQEYRPVVWVGYRDVNVSQHPRSQDVSPVRIHAHSFAVNQPSSDLWLSPDHAVFVENSLIPARYLVNGSSIVQEACEQISYWHVELDQHDIVLAEGLPCESYLDTGDRQGFANGCGAIEFHPSWRQGNHDMTLVMDALGYAPLRVTGSEVTRVRAQIAAREMSMRSEEHIGERSVA